MAYQKLNASRAWKVIPTDDGIIPEFMVKDGTGTTTGTSANGFKDATVNFLTLGVKRGMVVVNPASGASAIIQSVSEDEIIMNAQPVPNIGDAYAIYGGNNQGAVLYVGTGGEVRVLTSGNDDVVFAGVPGGTFIPVNCIKVFSTDTTASDILALW